MIKNLFLFFFILFVVLTLTRLFSPETFEHMSNMLLTLMHKPIAEGSGADTYSLSAPFGMPILTDVPVLLTTLITVLLFIPLKKLKFSHLGPHKEEGQ